MSICYHPWAALYVGPQQEFKPCCKFKGTIAHNLSDYQNSTELHEVRQQFLQGKKPDACQECWEVEDAGGRSKRQHDWEYQYHSIPPNLDNLKVLGISLNNVCNLACRICNSKYSTRWLPEEKKLQVSFPEIKIYPANENNEDALLQSLYDHVGTLTRVEFIGGEPFLAEKPFLSFLDKLIEYNPGQVDLQYITNGTTFPSDELWNRWEKFNTVIINLSIDGIEDKFEYARWPAKWDQCLDNIKKYQSRAGKNIKIDIAHSVCIFNLLELPNFVKWCWSMKLPVPDFNLVHYPSHYSITALPLDVKLKVKEILKQPIFGKIVNYMMSKDDSHEFDKTLKYVKILDKRRDQSFPDSFSTLYQLMDIRCQTLYQQY